jgi:SNF2 family DNA or RNA helicase
MILKTVPSTPCRLSGKKNTLPKKDAKKATSQPSNEDVMAIMKAEVQQRMDDMVSVPKKRQVVQSTKNGPKEIAVVEKTRRYDLESKDADPAVVKIYQRVRSKKRLAAELALLPPSVREAHQKKPMYGSQLMTMDKYRESPLVLDFSDPGTGKTRTALQAFSERRRKGGGKLLVLAPRTLLECAWGNDAREFCSDMTLSVAYAQNRQKAFDREADIYITNIDGIKWLLQNKAVLKGFDSLVVDELTAFKHRTSARSAAMRKLAKLFDYIAGLTGTPNAKSVTEIWHQAMIVDQGRRLGQGFVEFRNAVQTMGADGQWGDMIGAEEAVHSLLEDIMVRHRFENCMDIPPHAIHTIAYRPPEKLMEKYLELEARATLQHNANRVTAVNAAVLRNKLLQVASGAVYGQSDEDDPYGKTKPKLILDTDRYELVLDLVDEVDFPCLVFFNWGHQKEQLIQLAQKRGIPHELLDKTTSDARREEIVAFYQAGMYKVLFLHPRTGAHGLTLTRGRRTICVSPFDEADAIKQIFHRTYRGGQTERSETLMIEAEGTIEGYVYGNRDNKFNRMKKFLSLCETADPEELEDA